MAKECKIKEHSVELAKLLAHLKLHNPTQLQDRILKELNEEERKIYMKALKKKGQAERKRLFKLMHKGIHKSKNI